MLNNTAVNGSVGVEAMAHTNGPAGSAKIDSARFRPQSDQPIFGRMHVLAGDPGSVECGPRARSEIQARAARAQFFKASLFSDPAWDILLELFAAQQEGRRVSISAAGLTAEIPLTTALRWINALEREDLVERTGDPTDARRTFLKLSGKGLRAMTLYFQSCS
jgi:DNA-binding MarR family transcriptional regulator